MEGSYLCIMRMYLLLKTEHIYMMMHSHLVATWRYCHCYVK